MGMHVLSPLQSQALGELPMAYSAKVMFQKGWCWIQNFWNPWPFDFVPKTRPMPKNLKPQTPSQINTASLKLQRRVCLERIVLHPNFSTEDHCQIPNVSTPYLSPSQEENKNERENEALVLHTCVHCDDAHNTDIRGFANCLLCSSYLPPSVSFPAH